MLGNPLKWILDFRFQYTSNIDVKLLLPAGDVCHAAPEIVALYRHCRPAGASCQDNPRAGMVRTSHLVTYS